MRSRRKKDEMRVTTGQVGVVVRAQVVASLTKGGVANIFKISRSGCIIIRVDSLYMTQRSSSERICRTRLPPRPPDHETRDEES